MQITLKQVEITAAVAMYLNSMGMACNAATLDITYKQGRADHNGLTAQVDVDAPQSTAVVAPVEAAGFAISPAGEILLKGTAGSDTPAKRAVVQDISELNIPEVSPEPVVLEAATAEDETPQAEANAEPVPEDAPVEANKLFG